MYILCAQSGISGLHHWARVGGHEPGQSFSCNKLASPYHSQRDTVLFTGVRQ